MSWWKFSELLLSFEQNKTWKSKEDWEMEKLEIQLETMNMKERKQKLEEISSSKMNERCVGSENHCLPQEMHRVIAR